MLMEKRLTEEAAVREVTAKNEGEVTSMEYKSEGSALVNVSHLDIPAELAMIIQSLNGRYRYYHLYFKCYFCVGWKNANLVNGLRTVTESVLEDHPVLQELPDDVDSCTFAKFASTYYQVNDQQIHT